MLAAAIALIAFFLMPATEESLIGLDTPSTFDLVLEAGDSAVARDEDAIYLAYFWAVAALLAGIVLLLGITFIVDPRGRTARMRAAAMLGFVAALFLAAGWGGEGIAGHATVDALTHGTPLGFWAIGDFPATPGFAVMSVALLAALLAGIGARDPS